MWFAVRWPEVRQRGGEMSCHLIWIHLVSCGGVMWCGVMSSNVMWCLMWQDGMWCDVLCCDVVWCTVKQCDLMWSHAMGWDVMWLLVRTCDARTHDSKTLARPIPMRGGTMGRKAQNNAESSCQSTRSPTTHYNVTTTFMLDSRNTWHVQSIAGNLWDAKHNGTTTLKFGSRNTWNVPWNVQYIAGSNLWNAKRNTSSVPAAKGVDALNCSHS